MAVDLLEAELAAVHRLVPSLPVSSLSLLASSFGLLAFRLGVPVSARGLLAWSANE